MQGSLNMKHPWGTLQHRQPDSHKGTYGRVAVIGGSTGMSGAVCLSATAALRSGAGLVTAVVPQSIQAIVASYEPSYMSVGLPCDSDGALVDSCVDWVSQIQSFNAVAIGPGLGAGVPAGRLLAEVLRSARCPVVVDADGLNQATRLGLLMQHRSPEATTVLTPHPGEFARMLGRPVAEVQSRRQELAVEFAGRCGMIVVLKGHQTIVTNGQEVYVNSTGNPGMATGGSGDVLTGIVAAQLASGMPPFAATCLAVHIHGLAGDLAAERLSQRGLIASDLLDYLGPAWRRLDVEAADSWL